MSLIRVCRIHVSVSVGTTKDSVLFKDEEHGITAEITQFGDIKLSFPDGRQIKFNDIGEVLSARAILGAEGERHGIPNGVDLEHDCYERSVRMKHEAYTSEESAPDVELSQCWVCGHICVTT